MINVILVEGHELLTPGRPVQYLYSPTSLLYDKPGYPAPRGIIIAIHFNDHQHRYEWQVRWDDNGKYSIHTPNTLTAICHHCKRTEKEHMGRKCLFASTEFK